MNAESEIKRVENTLRDCIASVMSKRFGAGWMESLRVSKGRVERWYDRRNIERKRLRGSPLDDRPLYYSDFYDLREIITSHWDDGFSQVFGDKKLVEVYLSEMERLRDPHAHRRELSISQEYLIFGISGDLCARVVKYRSQGEMPDNYFPKIDFVTDSFGNSLTSPEGYNPVIAPQTLRPGDKVSFTISATDPHGGQLLYSCQRIGQYVWVTDHKFEIEITEKDIGMYCDFNLAIKSTRDYHAMHGEMDQVIMFRYKVLPRPPA